MRLVVHMQEGEVNDHAWLPLEDLMDRATYPEMKEVARRVWQVARRLSPRMKYSRIA